MAKRKSSIPQYKRRRRRSFLGRLLGWIIKLVLGLILFSILWVLAYRFVNPPITINMIGDIIHRRGAHKDWMPIEEIDRDMVRAAIAGEDSKFCSHNGFDLEAIEDAMKGTHRAGGSAADRRLASRPRRTPSFGTAAAMRGRV